MSGLYARQLSVNRGYVRACVYMHMDLMKDGIKNTTYVRLSQPTNGLINHQMAKRNNERMRLHAVLKKRAVHQRRHLGGLRGPSPPPPQGKRKKKEKREEKKEKREKKKKKERKKEGDYE